MSAIKQQLVSSDKVTRNNIIPGTNGRKFITVHETGNKSRGAGAQAHANLQSNGFTESWHYQVDDKVIIQSWLDTTKCAHAGDGASGPGNNDSIAIEVCVNPDSDRTKTWQNVIWLVKTLMGRHMVSERNVVQHNYWSGKNCPTDMRAGHPMSWNVFINALTGPTVAPGVSPTIPAPTGTGKPRQPYSHDQAAQEVVDGLWGTGAERKRRLEAAGFVYNSVQRRVNELVRVPAGKSMTQLAREVIDGKWGNEPERSRRLRAAGYDAAAVQRAVNAAVSVKSVSQLATEVIDGKWGNEPQRSQRLRSAGYDPVAVQTTVNRRFGK